MPTIFKTSEIEFNELQSDVNPYSWFSSPRLSAIANSDDLYFNIRKLDPDKYSYPYHFHHNADELFILFEGSATLRTLSGLQIVTKGDIVFFEKGNAGAHQLYNHTTEPCIYFDLRTNNKFDVSEFPDSNKILFVPSMEANEKGEKVDYFKNEENITDIWDKLK